MPAKTLSERRYWDACCFIAVVNKEVGRVVVCADILREAQSVDPRIEIATSVITIAEVVKPLGCAGLTEEQEAQIDAFFDNDWLITVNADRTVMEDARALQRRFGLKVRDSIHVASALAAGAPTIETYDGTLMKWNGKIPVPMSTNPLVIREPYFAWPVQDPLRL